MATDEEKPRVLLLSLNMLPWFDRMYEDFMHKLCEKATVHRVMEPIPAIRVLTQNFKAVLVTDEALTTTKHALVWQAILEYVRAGGTAICMGMFSSYARNMGRFFEKAGLRWDQGEEHRITVFLNKGRVPQDVQQILPASYRLQAVFLTFVSPAQAWYRPTEKYIQETQVAEAGAVSSYEYPVAMAKIGDGNLGYVGDVGAEAGSDSVILAMCGLCD